MKHLLNLHLEGVKIENEGKALIFKGAILRGEAYTSFEGSNVEACEFFNVSEKTLTDYRRFHKNRDILKVHFDGNETTSKRAMLKTITKPKAVVETPVVETPVVETIRQLKKELAYANGRVEKLTVQVETLKEERRELKKEVKEAVKTRDHENKEKLHYVKKNANTETEHKELVERVKELENINEKAVKVEANLRWLIQQLKDDSRGSIERNTDLNTRVNELFEENRVLKRRLSP